jgi:hypothetical protein
MSAAFVPRVRILAVCDEAVRSEIEDGVFTLEGMRQGFHSESFPCLRSLGVYLLLSYYRVGTFDGQVKMVHDRDEKVIRYAKFTASFGNGAEHVPLAIDLDNCVFPDAGAYTVQVEFWTEAGDVLKAEEPLFAWQLEE